MNRWNEFPFVRILLPFLTGSLCCVFTPLHLPYGWLAALLLPALFLHIHSKNKTVRLYKYAGWIGFFWQLLIFLSGNVLTHQRIDLHNPDHFINHLQQADYFLVSVTEPPVEKERSYKVMINVTYRNSNGNLLPAMGKSIVYLEKNEAAGQLRYGDVLMMKNTLHAVEGPANPDQFDYRRYLWYREIYATAYLKKTEWMKLPEHDTHSLFAFTFTLRDLSVQAIRQYVTSKRESAVVEALVIGYRDNMSAETMQSYTASGVVHVLAVSGLHVAIVFALLHQLLFFLNRKKHGKLLQSVIILSAIWMFTLVTGLSGSVLRASAMFSFITIGKNLKRPVNLFNILACSAMAILMIDPLLIMDVGFQLSYLAVAGIGTLNQYIDHWLPRENKIVDFLWKMVAMSLAAQIATFPLTTFYFHQFPLYFLAANIVVIPAAGIILHLGIAIIVLQWIPVMAVLTGDVIRWITYLMNEFILHIQSLPAATIHLPYTDFFQMLLTGIFIVSATNFFISHLKKWLFAAALCVSCLLTIHCLRVCSVFQQNTFTVYAFKKSGALEFRSENEAAMFRYAGSISNADSVYLQQHWRLNNIVPVFSGKTSGVLEGKVNAQLSHYGSFFQFGDYKIALISNPLPKRSAARKLKVDALLISGNPSLSIKDLTNYFESSAIIFDGSNSSYHISKWQEEANRLGLATHDVTKDGAFIKHI